MLQKIWHNNNPMEIKREFLLNHFVNSNDESLVETKCKFCGEYVIRKLKYAQIGCPDLCKMDVNTVLSWNGFEVEGREVMFEITGNPIWNKSS